MSIPSERLGTYDYQHRMRPTAAEEPEMNDPWISDLSARALNWGAWAVVVLSVFGSAFW
jgi:hypothetical protein